MSWHKLALNPQSLESVYETVPELENVELFSLNLNREGSSAQIRFDLPHFPDHPPTRWSDSFNTAQIQLSFFGLTNFKAEGWQPSMKVKIDIKSEGKLLKTVISNPEIDLKFSFLCDFLQIENISAYQNNPPQ